MSHIPRGSRETKATRERRYERKTLSRSGRKREIACPGWFAEGSSKFPIGDNASECEIESHRGRRTRVHVCSAREGHAGRRRNEARRKERGGMVLLQRVATRVCSCCVVVVVVVVVAPPPLCGRRGQNPGDLHKSPVDRTKTTLF